MPKNEDLHLFARSSRPKERAARARAEPPNTERANAYAERWVWAVRADCLGRILILGRRHLEHVLRVYRRHYNEHRPHRALDRLSPDGPIALRQATAIQSVRRRQLLGGLIREYKAAA